MKKYNKTKKKAYFTRLELAIWLGFAALIIVAFLLFDRKNPLSLAASLVGISSLIFNAKGNPLGQALILVFSLLYAIISYEARYFGEMITYMCMSAPMALIALIGWIRNPYEKGKSEVRVNQISIREIGFAVFLSAVVTVIIYFVLRKLGTATLTVSTVSVATSFVAAYFTARRSALFALFYAANDLVLILLWSIAIKEGPSAVCVVICFVAFLVIDTYTFVSWNKMHKRQSNKEYVGTAFEAEM